MNPTLDNLLAQMADAKKNARRGDDYSALILQALVAIAVELKLTREATP